MTFATITTKRDRQGVVTLTLSRPAKKNAMSAEMIAELTTFADRVRRDPSVRAMVLRGAGDTFCAGGDLEWMMNQIKADRPTRIREARSLAEMLRTLNTLPVPLIGVVQGGAYGGALGLVAVCDVVLAAAGARFAFTETRLGLIPATIAPYVIARMGEGPARRVFMSARRFSAEEAERLGLVARVVAGEEIDAAIETEVAPYLGVAPGAVGRAKALARSLGPPIDDATIDRSIEALADAWETDEARVGIAAFLDKTPRPWS